MKFNKAQLKIFYEAGEVISLDVIPFGTEQIVYYRSDEQDGALIDNQLRLRPQKNSVLVMSFDFSESEGGIYKIVIQGSYGGQQHSLNVFQTGNSTKTLNFSLEGDRDVDF